ncbi:hypothetical protein [Curtobacterium sp. TXMA1]|uniref:hypothetical protein n=1 Tax=Curtobacterium sp. TXMA1 TaxID=2876939 RepID=UPI001CCCE42C|nr:hypothetical protein [Curtobacterium sp. TXMA1]UBQ02525.1 hypothetical protein LCG91_15995 [Curtobacterium sp. TXMA1]
MEQPREDRELEAPTHLPQHDLSTTRSRLEALPQLQPAPSTAKSYARSWQRFLAWCDERGCEALPAEPINVVSYIIEAGTRSDGAGRPAAYNTISGWVAAINKAHEMQRLPRPGDSLEVKTALGRLRATLPPARRTPVLSVTDLRRILDDINVDQHPQAVHGARDSAIILIAFSGAFQRSQVAALRYRDIGIDHEEGLLVTVREGPKVQGVKLLKYAQDPRMCPVCAFIRWAMVHNAIRLEQTTATVQTVLDGFQKDQHCCVVASDPALYERRTNTIADQPRRRPVFQPISTIGRLYESAPHHPKGISTQVVNDVVKKHAQAVGLHAEGVGAHSLRASYINRALQEGGSIEDVMRQSWLRSPTYASNFLWPERSWW